MFVASVRDLVAGCRVVAVIRAFVIVPDFSVVLCRPNFMLLSEEHSMKTHKNQWLLALLSSPNIPCGATNRGTHSGVGGADAFAVT